MFNLDTLAMNPEAVELHLRHPATEELLFADEAKEKPVAIYIYGQGSQKYRNAVTAMQNRTLKRGNKKPTAEQLREESIEVLVACSERAVNLSYKDAPLDNAAAFRALYSDPKFTWLKDQVDAGLGDVSNFLNQ